MMCHAMMDHSIRMIDVTVMATRGVMHTRAHIVGRFMSNAIARKRRYG
jgi:hypothetical protein